MRMIDGAAENRQGSEDNMRASEFQIQPNGDYL